MNAAPVKRRRLPVAWILCALALVAAVALQWLKSPHTAGVAVRAGRLAKQLPVTIPGWQARDLPLGATEGQQRATERLLRYDDFVYREYAQGSRRFAVYAAYWAKGKMPTREVAAHTPDRCWTENGWRCLAFEHRVVLGASGAALPVMEARTFVPPDSETREYVVFWLLNDGQLFDFGRGLNTVPNPFKWCFDVVDEAVAGSGEHLFVRLTSNLTFDQLRDDEGFKIVLSTLAQLQSIRPLPATTPSH